MEQKFKHGDIVKISTTGDRVMVIEYKVNFTGGVINAPNHESQLRNPHMLSMGMKHLYLFTLIWVFWQLRQCNSQRIL